MKELYPTNYKWVYYQGDYVAKEINGPKVYALLILKNKYPLLSLSKSHCQLRCFYTLYELDCHGKTFRSFQELEDALTNEIKTRNRQIKIDAILEELKSDLS